MLVQGVDQQADGVFGVVGLRVTWTWTLVCVVGIRSFEAGENEGRLALEKGVRRLSLLKLLQETALDVGGG